MTANYTSIKSKFGMETVNQAAGVYSVCGRLWVVGARYKLHEHVGAGSYGEVCRATDMETMETVALKKIPNVFLCPVLAKRVIREVCIMRRLRHPYIIALFDIFTSASLDIKDGIDLYIATEFAKGGDMHHMENPLTTQQVQLLIWQLLTSVGYLHSCDVWHRDIKSENVLLTSTMDVKLCDFGLSRSVMEPSENIYMDSRQTLSKDPPTPCETPVLKRQYTKTVVTPTYRAPEVIMSQGHYTSAIDIWATGCIFWELLDRQCNFDGLAVPRPLFGVQREPCTPLGGKLYAEDGGSELAEQLDVIFDVIGTPCWKDVESVPSELWRAYLKKLPGRAGNLVSNSLNDVDEEALDLLSRMLAFDPARRCTAEEALSHTYFKNLPLDCSRNRPPNVSNEEVRMITYPALALGVVEKALEASLLQTDGGQQTMQWLLQREVDGQQQERENRIAAMGSIRHRAGVAKTITMNNSSVVPLTAQLAPVPVLRNEGVKQIFCPVANQPVLGYQERRDSNAKSLPIQAKSDEKLPAKKRLKKLIVKQGSFHAEMSFCPKPATQPNIPTTRLSKRSLENGYEEHPNTDEVRRRSRRLKYIQAQAGFSHGKRVAPRG